MSLSIKSVITHSAALVIGFAAGVYTLPLLIAPDAPTEQQLAAASTNVQYTTQFNKQRQDSDVFHWGKGEVSITDRQIVFKGELSPGPDYKLYLSPEYLETEDQFGELKPQMIQVSAINTFDGFIVDIPEGIDLEQFNTVVIWCEQFGEYITSGKYR